MNKTLTMSSSRLISFLVPAALVAAFALLFATAPAQSAHAAPVQESRQCTGIRSLGNTAIDNAKRDIVVMKATFAATYQAMLDTWKLQDKINEVSWKLTINGFTAGITWKIDNASPARKTILEKYKTTVLDSLSQYKLLIDAARAQYREDMAALVREHQANLIKLAEQYVTTLTNNLTNALTDCSKAGAGLKFLATMLNSGLNYIGKVLNQGVTYIGKALKIVATYVNSIVNGVSSLINGIVGAIVTALTALVKTL